MFVCDQLRMETWQPDFSSSAEASPTWTRLTCRGSEIANSLEWSEWAENPVQVILCDACGHAGCASDGYVHVSRLHRHVLWSAAQVSSDSEDAYGVYEIPRVIRTLGALAFPVEAWNEWSTTIKELPRADRLIEANHAAVADAWVLGPARSTATILTHLRDRLVGGDTLDRETAFGLVEQTLADLHRNARASFDQPFVALEQVGAKLESLYFDGPAELDWPAFAVGRNETYIVLDRQHLARIKA